MLKEKIVTKENGLKSEDCAVIAQAASLYKSDIYIIKDNKKVNAKSIMGVISLNMKKGEKVYLAITGEDENKAIEHLYNLL